MSEPIKLKSKDGCATCEVPEKYVDALIASGKWIRDEHPDLDHRPHPHDQASRAKDCPDMIDLAQDIFCIAGLPVLLFMLALKSEWRQAR